jgi:hypothetical protein
MSKQLAAKLTPLLDRVLVEKVAAKTKTVGGILLPESASSKARPAEGAGATQAAAWPWSRRRQTSACVVAGAPDD